MNPESDPKEICRGLAAELRDLAAWLSAGQLSPEQFRAAVLELERAKVTRFNFTLSGTVSPEGSVEFALRFSESQKLCARMQFTPASGELTPENICG